LRLAIEISTIRLQIDLRNRFGKFQTIEKHYVFCTATLAHKCEKTSRREKNFIEIIIYLSSKINN